MSDRRCGKPIMADVLLMCQRDIREPERWKESLSAMRVLMISKTFMLTPAQRLLEWLAEMPNIDLTLVTPQTWRDDMGTLVPFQHAHTTGYRVISLPVRGNGHYHRYTYRGLRTTIAAVRPDLLHVDEEPYNPAAWQALWLASQRGIPAVLVAWQNQLRQYPPPYAWLEGWAYRRAAGILAGNRSAGAVVRAKGYRGPLTTLSLHGLDPDLWPVRSALPPGADQPFTVGFVGRLVPEKGVDLLLAALASLPPRIRLVVVGTGPAEQSLRNQARACGLAARVSWLGVRPAEAIPACMRSFDVLALPSRERPGWSEQFGRVLIEAMACGVPVIGAATGEIPQVIGDAGVIVLPEDPASLAAAIRCLANDAAQWQTLHQRGLHHVAAHHSHAAIARQLAALYATIETEKLSSEDGMRHADRHAWPG